LKIGHYFCFNYIVLRTVIIHSIILVFFLPAKAQQFGSHTDIFFGEDMSLGNDVIIPEIFGHDENNYYTYSFDYREGIQLLNSEFLLVREEYLDLMNGLRNRTLLALFHFHGEIYMFTSEQRIKRMLLYVETIDKKTLLQNGDERLLMDVQNLAGWATEFGFKISRQENKLLVFSRLDVLSRHVQDLHFELYGEGLTLEWEADQRITYPQRPPRESIVKVSEEGNVYIISLQDDQKIKSLWNTTKNRYHLIAVTEMGQNANTYLLDFPNLYIRGIQIEPGIDHDLSLAGFYSPTHFRAMVDGVFYMELDNETGQFRNQRFYEFEPWFLKEAISPQPKKPPEEMFYFEARYLIRRDNGDFIFLAENEFDQTYDTYRNIMAASFSPGGTLNWKRVIPKMQSIDPNIPRNYSSFSVHAPWLSEITYLVFNDDNKNGEWASGDKLKSFNPNDKANLKIVGIGPAGELTSSIIYIKSRRRMKTPVPLQYYDLLNNEMVIPSIRYKKYNYLKITFNE